MWVSIVANFDTLYSSSYQLTVTDDSQWKIWLKDFSWNYFLIIYLQNMKRVSEQRPISEFESSNFMNICRICLKELPLVGNVSVFSRIDSQNWTITVVDKQFEVCISDIISLCSTKITVNIQHRMSKLAHCYSFN